MNEPRVLGIVTNPRTPLVPHLLVEVEGKKIGIPQVALAIVPVEVQRSIAEMAAHEVVIMLMSPCLHVFPMGGKCGAPLIAHPFSDHGWTNDPPPTFDFQVSADGSLPNVIGNQHG